MNNSCGVNFQNFSHTAKYLFVQLSTTLASTFRRATDLKLCSSLFFTHYPLRTRTHAQIFVQAYHRYTILLYKVCKHIEAWSNTRDVWGVIWEWHVRSSVTFEISKRPYAKASGSTHKTGELSIIRGWIFARSRQTNHHTACVCFVTSCHCDMRQGGLLVLENRLCSTLWSSSSLPGFVGVVCYRIRCSTLNVAVH